MSPRWLGLLGLTAACGLPSYAFDVPDAAIADRADAARPRDAAVDVRHPRDARDAKEHETSRACGACAEGPPAGWTGPVALYHGAGKPPSCEGEYSVLAYNGHGDLVVPAAGCASCACAETGSSSCSAGVANAGTGCGDPVCGSFDLPAGACVSLASSGASCVGSTVAYNPQGPSGSPVGCSASGGALTAPAASFGSAARGCASSSSSSGCGANEVCAPLPPAAFNEGLCIVQSGDVPCPGASVYSTAHVFYAGFADGRACSACQCTAPTCSGVVDFFSAPGCSGPTGASGIPAFCVTPSAASASAMFVPSSMTCAASGGTLSGDVTGTTPTTFCCTR